MDRDDIRHCILALMTAATVGCSANEPMPLAGTEAPYFPVCVASEAGGYQERKYIRMNWFGFDDGQDSEIIDADCIAVQP